MKKLLKGIIDFRQRFLRRYREKFSKLAKEGQAPDLLLVSCCDSRVAPNVFASTNPGDVFVLRNIGNLIPPYSQVHEGDISAAAALDYSLLFLNVSDIVICGHSECGAMCSFFNAAMQDTPSLPLKEWLHYAEISYLKFKELKKNNVEFEKFKKSHASQSDLSDHNLLSQLNVLQQIENIKSYPEVKKRYIAHQLRVHAWWFDLVSGNIYYYNENLKKFILLDEIEAERLLLKGLST